MEKRDKLKQQIPGEQSTTQNQMRLLLARIEKSNQYPCFIVAPKHCGQEKLLSVYSERRAIPAKLSTYIVDTDGSCVLAREGNELLHDHGPTGKLYDHITVILCDQWLEDDATQRLSDELDALLEQGRQVIVLCPPQNDRFQNLQSDRLLITALELKQAGLFPPDHYTMCLKQFMTEFLPLEVRLTAILAATLGATDLEELSGLGYEVSSDLPQVLTTLNPLFSVTLNGAGVKSEHVDVHELSQELVGAIAEYLESRETQAGLPLLASRITRLSIALLERGDLESSHQVLGIAEELIQESASRDEGAAFNNTSRGDIALRGSQIQQQTKIELVGSGNVADSAVRNKQESSTSTIPPLRLRLFGEFEVSLEGEVLKNRYLSRAKVRRLMAYLALNQHRNVLRDNLMEYLWPYLDFDRAQKNLYTSWCMLAKGLGSESVKDCPYIQRTGEIYQLNKELVICDTRQFEELARVVLCGQLDTREQFDSLLTLEALYRESLVADIPVDSFISSKAESYRSMMVDALLLATRQLRAEEEVERALFYARAAYNLDESREDVYRELMDTQYVAGQRTSAMQTYFSCKRYLSDELGILPSKSTTALYQDLLLDNCR